MFKLSDHAPLLHDHHQHWTWTCHGTQHLYLVPIKTKRAKDGVQRLTNKVHQAQMGLKKQTHTQKMTTRCGVLQNEN